MWAARFKKTCFPDLVSDRLVIVDSGEGRV